MDGQLRILVIGRGVGDDYSPSKGVVLSFVNSAIDNSEYISLNNIDYVFQHVGPGNPEAAAAIEFWKQEGQANKVALLSGGSFPDDFMSSRLPYLENIPNRKTLLGLNWVAVSLNFSGSAEELLDVLLFKPAPYIIALSILCQGYIIIHAIHNYEVSVSAEGFGDVLRHIGWTDSMRTLLPDEMKDLNRISQVRSPRWWLQGLGLWDDDNNRVAQDNEMWDTFVNTITAEWVSGNTIKQLPESINLLIERLRSADEITNPISVAEVYIDISKRFGVNICGHA